MRAVIQRVSEASVTVADREHAAIGIGFVVLVGIEAADTEEDADWLAGKIARLRLFSDADGRMNRSLEENHGGILLISQFTLHASTRKGNRPSFIRAARPEQARPLYDYLTRSLKGLLGRPVETGEFGANMQVALINDGPVTLWIDTQDRE